MREIELKFKVDSLVLIKEKLKELDIKVGEAFIQKDVNFVHKKDTHWYTPNTHDYAYPRIRTTGSNKPLWSVKRPICNAGACLDALEAEMTIEDDKEAIRIMEMFDFIPSVTVNKVRRKAKHGHITITLDEVDELGSFVEVEIVTGVEDTGAEKVLANFAQDTLGLDVKNSINKGYDILLFEKTENTS
jgi:adenylate cyclase class 2